ncbi:hypothetical protein WSS15_27300 [Acetobacter pasteurianus]|nr:hypothetical protein WSS15_27300 [Acetobacter pasteurianus]
MLADVGEDALKFKGVYLDANGTGMYARSACLARSKKRMQGVPATLLRRSRFA